MPKTESTEELRLSLPLLEEAACLLRRAPPAAWACHLIGGGPFALGLVQFWAAFSAGGRAQPLAWGLALAALHLWMRVWQSRFGAMLFELRSGRDPAPWTAAEWLRAAASQALYGAPAFIALLPALLATVPYGWVFAFYQNLTVTGHAPGAAARAWRAAREAPYQNHAALAWLLLCWLVAFVNVFTVVASLPAVVKIFVPVEWAFTRNPFWFFNTTALCAVLALTYLALDPLTKAVYALRTFYGLTRATGEDLLTDWRRLRPARPLLATLLLLAPLLLRAQAPDAGRESVPAAAPVSAFAPPAAGGLRAEALDRQIDLALRDARYDWRAPVDLAPEELWLTRQVKRLGQAVGRWFERLGDALRRFGQWWRRFFKPRDASWDASRSGFTSEGLSKLLLALLLATAAVLLFLLWRSRRQRPAAPPVEATPQAAAAPDVADEGVTAEVLPDDEWLSLAEQLRAAQEYRKSARAFFLALLARLARRELIALQRCKTNADYLRELRRRTVGQLFDEQPFRHASRLFEAGWYGEHPVTPDTLDALRLDVEAYRHG